MVISLAIGNTRYRNLRDKVRIIKRWKTTSRPPFVLNYPNPRSIELHRSNEGSTQSHDLRRKIVSSLKNVSRYSWMDRRSSISNARGRLILYTWRWETRLYLSWKIRGWYGPIEGSGVTTGVVGRPKGAGKGNMSISGYDPVILVSREVVACQWNRPDNGRAQSGCMFDSWVENPVRFLRWNEASRFFPPTWHCVTVCHEAQQVHLTGN